VRRLCAQNGQYYFDIAKFHIQVRCRDNIYNRGTRRTAPITEKTGRARGQKHTFISLAQKALQTALSEILVNSLINQPQVPLIQNLVLKTHQPQTQTQTQAKIQSKRAYNRIHNCPWDKPLPPKPTDPIELKKWKYHSRYKAAEKRAYQKKSRVEKTLILNAVPTSKWGKGAKVTRASWFFNFWLPYYCSKFGDSFFELLETHTSSTSSGMKFLVPILQKIKERKAAQICLKKARRTVWAKASRSDSAVIANLPRTEFQCDMCKKTKANQRLLKQHTSRCKHKHHPCTVEGCHMVFSTRDYLKTHLFQHQHSKTEVNVTVPDELCEILDWPTRQTWNPALFVKALHESMITPTVYEKFWNILGSPPLLPSGDKVRRWNTFKFKYLEKVLGIEVLGDSEHSYLSVTSIIIVFSLIIRLVLSQGKELPDDTLVVHGAWDSRKIPWAQSAYQIVPVCDGVYRTGLWEWVLPFLTWNASDTSIEDIEKYGKSVIQMNKSIRNGTLKVPVNGKDYFKIFHQIGNLKHKTPEAFIKTATPADEVLPEIPAMAHEVCVEPILIASESPITPTLASKILFDSFVV